MQQQSALGTPTVSGIAFFFVIVALTLAITWWAAKRTRSTKEFYAAGRSVSPLQNGLALAGDYMSAASFLGIAGLVALKGYDGMIYATGWLVGWPALMFLIAEPLRNLGKYTFADVVAFRLKQTPVRISSAIGGILTVLIYTIAQMVGSGSSRISAVNLSPATRASDSICSPTVTPTPGMVRLGRGPSFPLSMPAAWTRKLIAERGLAWVCSTVRGTGRIASWPASGSRIMPEKKPEAALFGLPGRTQIVGRRMPMPSKMPRRV